MERKLSELFKLSGLTLSEVSKKSGVSLSTTHRYLNGGTHEMKPEYYKKLYDVLIRYSQSMMNNPEEENAILDNVTHEISTETGYPVVKLEHNRMPRRGDVYFVKNPNATGNETYGDRPCVIVSNNKINSTLGTVEVVYLTKQPKMPLPYHVTIQTNITSTVLCEQVCSISKSKLLNYLGSVTETEMLIIEKAIMNSLDIKVNSVNVKHNIDYIVMQTERSFYKDFYERIMKIPELRAQYGTL